MLTIAYQRRERRTRREHWRSQRYSLLPDQRHVGGHRPIAISTLSSLHNQVVRPHPHHRGKRSSDTAQFWMTPGDGYQDHAPSSKSEPLGAVAALHLSKMAARRSGARPQFWNEPGGTRGPNPKCYSAACEKASLPLVDVSVRSCGFAALKNVSSQSVAASSCSAASAILLQISYPCVDVTSGCPPTTDPHNCRAFRSPAVEPRSAEHVVSPASIKAGPSQCAFPIPTLEIDPIPQCTAASESVG